MKIRDVRAMHCQKLLNKMIGEYAISTVYQAYICLGAMLRSALLNDLIDRQPLNGVCMPRAKAKNAIRFLTVQEQLVFTEAIKGKAYENQFQLMLQTGLRTGEMMGLTWDCIDFKNRMIKVEKQIEFRYGQQSWRAMPPKSTSGYRMVPMTMKAYEILSEMYHARGKRRLSPLMEDTLEYLDTRTDKVKSFKMKELVFIGERSGEPVKHSAYCTYIYKICDDFGIARLSMHSLRHTFATRCIERGVSIKALQRLMGHANIATTLDIYVHVSDDFLREAMQIFEMEEE
jgi:integrase